MPPRSATARLLLFAVILSGCSAGSEGSSNTAAPITPESSPSTEASLSTLPTTTPWSAALGTRLASTDVPERSSTQDSRALSPAGPWLVFSDGEAIWGTDGNVVRQVYRPPSRPTYGFSLAPSPSGGTLAFAAAPQDSAEDPPQLDLFLAQFPEAEPLSARELISLDQIHLLSAQVPGDASDDWSELWFRVEQIRAAVSRPQSLAWSPDGSLLAMVAVLDAPSTDLYTYDPETGDTTRLTDGPYQTAELLWSPTGRYIAHAATSDINIGRNGPDLIVEGLWEAEPGTGKVVSLADWGTEALQWIGPDTLLLFTAANMPCSFSGLTSVNVLTGESRSLWPGSFDRAAADPVSGTVLVGVGLLDPSLAYEDVCPPWEPNGLYLLRPATAPVRLGDYAEDSGSVQPSLVWSEDAGLFMASTPTGVIMVAPSGEMAMAASGLEHVPLPSPSGDFMAVEGRDTGLAILTPDGTVRLETSMAVCQAVWLPDSSALYFTDGDALYLASAPDFAAKEVFRSDSWGLCSTPLALLTP